ncbi:hypothetical protein CPB84DRAFT_1768139 [Gymnopilus junonius]|uniref:Uncharacterized protein n=1 Tax=Gymnopilus junonius TaxID=109634 RepID=A0A9P5NY95_GYMJU|nr:hypothetical protein CPB84DRAFT_1768139 [Gymnopilus junonius]
MLPPTSTPTHASGRQPTLNHPRQASTQRLGRTGSTYFSSECLADPSHPFPSDLTFNNGEQQDAFGLFGNSPTFSLPDAGLFNYAHDSNPPTERSLRLGEAISSFQHSQDISNSTITPPSLLKFHDSVNPFQLDEQMAYVQAHTSTSNTGTSSERQNLRREAFYAPTSREGTNYYNYEVPSPAYQEQIDLLYGQSPPSSSGIAQQHPSLCYPQPLSAAPYNNNNAPANNAPKPLIQPLAVQPPTTISGLALQHHPGHYPTMDIPTAGGPQHLREPQEQQHPEGSALHRGEAEPHSIIISYRTFITGNSTSSENDYIEQERGNGKSSDGSSPQETGSVGSEMPIQPPEIYPSFEGSIMQRSDRRYRLSLNNPASAHAHPCRPLHHPPLRLQTHQCQPKKVCRRGKGHQKRRKRSRRILGECSGNRRTQGTRIDQRYA